MAQAEAQAPTEVEIHHPLEGRMDEGHQLVGMFTLDAATGNAVLTVLHEEVRPRLEPFAGGLTSLSLQRIVTPDDGPLFLGALLATLANSTYWRALPRPGAGAASRSVLRYGCCLSYLTRKS